MANGAVGTKLWPKNHLTGFPGETGAKERACVCASSIRMEGDVAQMVERPLSMREVQGSIPCFSTIF